MSEANIQEALQAYNITDAAIAEMSEAYMGLTVDGVEDKDGFKAVSQARQVVKKRRVAVEKTRKELKADALEYGRKVDAEANRIKGLLQPIEDHLQAQEDEVKAEKERLKKEADERRRAIILARVEKLAGLGSSLLAFEVERMSDTEFAEALNEETEAHAERERRAAEEKAKAEAEAAERKAERERNAKERAELDAERKRLDEEKAAAERAAAERKAAQEREAELERAKQEAAAKAKREAEEAAERERAEAEAKAKAEEARRLEDERTRPDREKLERLADSVSCADLEFPHLSEDVQAPVRKILDDAAARLRALAVALCPENEEVSHV